MMIIKEIKQKYIHCGSIGYCILFMKNSSEDEKERLINEVNSERNLDKNVSFIEFLLFSIVIVFESEVTET